MGESLLYHYKGKFLYSNSPPEDDWVAVQRYRFRMVMLDTFCILAVRLGVGGSLQLIEAKAKPL